MKKTVIDELIDWLDMSIENCKVIPSPQSAEALRVTKVQVERLKEAHKQEIIEAYNVALTDGDIINKIGISAEQYYKETYLD